MTLENGVEGCGEQSDPVSARIGSLAMDQIAAMRDKKALDARLSFYGLDPANVVSLPPNARAVDEPRELLIKRWAIARLEGYPEGAIRRFLMEKIPMGKDGVSRAPTYKLPNLLTAAVKQKVEEHDSYKISAAALEGDAQIKELLEVIKEITAIGGEEGIGTPEKLFRDMHKLPPYLGSKLGAAEIIDLHSFLVAYILAMSRKKNIEIAPKLNTRRSLSATNINSAFQRYLSNEAWSRLPARVGTSA